MRYPGKVVTPQSAIAKSLHPDVIVLQLEQIQRLRDRDPKIALLHCEQLLAQLAGIPISPLWLYAQLTYAYVLIAVGRPKDALELCRRWASHILQANIADARVRSLYFVVRGIAHTYLGQLKHGMECFQRLLDFSRQTGNLRDECRASLNLGWVHTCMENFPSALEYFSRALTLAQHLGLDVAEAITLENIGIVYDVLGNDDLALENYYRAYQVRRRGGYTSALAQSMLNIAVIHNKRGHYYEALKMARSARQIAHRCEDLRVEVYCLVAMGRAYREIGGLKRAVQLFQTALRMQQGAGYRGELCATHCDIAEVYKRMGTVEVAQQHLEHAYSVAQEMGEPNMLMYVSEQLYLLAKQRGALVEAITWLEAYHQWYVELMGRRREEEASRQMMMETIARLSRENEEYRRRLEEMETIIENQRRQIGSMIKAIAQGEGSMKTLGHLINEVGDSAHSHISFKLMLQSIDYLVPGFLGTVVKRFPSLTQTELMVCALIRLHMRTKEIAELLGISIKTVEHHREHIRAKCGLGRRVNLATYLCSIE